MFLYAQRLREEGDPGVRYVGEALERATRMQARLIDDLLDVTDTGIGIGPGFLPHIFFNRFSQDGGTSIGLGLGLTIVRHLAEAHGGQLQQTAAARTRGRRCRSCFPSSAIPIKSARSFRHGRIHGRA